MHAKKHDRPASRPEIRWSPEAIAAADRIANAMIAWHNGLLRVGRTPEEDVPLPWNLKLFAWFTRKCGLNLLDLVCIYSTHPTGWGRAKAILGVFARNFWRWLRIY
jgi:hypothetical protein